MESIPKEFELANAVEGGDIERVKKILQENPELVNHSYGEHNITPLTLASTLGHAEVVKEILTHNNVDINFANCYGYSAIHYASQNKHLDVVKLLIAANANVDAVGYDGSSSLHLSSALSDSLGIVKILVDSKANVNAVNDVKETPLHWATLYGDGKILPVVKELLQSKSDVNATTSDGDTALHATIKNTNIEPDFKLDIIKLLLQNSADKTIKNKDGKTADQLTEEHCIKELFQISN